MSSNFFAMVERMKLIDRWALMNNTGKENIAEHSHTVAVIAHALALIGNKNSAAVTTRSGARCWRCTTMHRKSSQGICPRR